MNRRILYIVIVVFVLVVGIFVLRPMLTAPKGGGAKPATTAAAKPKTRKATADTGAVATKPVPAAKAKPARPARGRQPAPAAQPAPAPAAVTSPPPAQESPATETPPVAAAAPRSAPAPAAPAKAVKGKAAPKASESKPARAVRGRPAVPAAPAAPVPVEAPVAARDTTAPPLSWGGDPFVRDWLMAGELRDMKLRAVTIGARSLALINDRVVTQGDTINGKRVALITRDSVVFEFGGQRRGLKIGE